MHVDLLDLNLTIIYQWIMFMIGLLIIYGWIFKPIVKVLDEREKKVKESSEGTVGKEADEQESVYNRALKKLRNEGSDLRRGLRAEASLKEQEILSDAREKTQQELSVRREKLAKEIGKTRDELKAELPSLTKAVVTRLLGKEVDA